MQILKSVSLSVIVLLSALTLVTAQTQDNYEIFENKLYYFGATLGYNYSNYRVSRGESFTLSNDSLTGITSVQGSGFNFHVTSNLKLSKNIDIRFIPGFVFAERALEYDPTRHARTNYLKKIEAISLELPLHLRYKLPDYYNKRFYVLAGMKYSYDVRNRSQQVTPFVKRSPSDFAIEYGAGIQIFCKYFIFAPEFKMSHGLNNRLIYPQGFNESGILEKLLSRMFTISFHFDG